jgi:FeS assembly SUF system protein
MKFSRNTKTAMNEGPVKPDPTHLPVLPHSGKVDQLRHEAAMNDKPAQDQAPNAPTPAPPTSQPAAPPPNAEKTVEYKLLEGKIIAAISTVFDPEIPVNIYELGLIYDIAIDAEKNATIRMTLTSPGCPVAGTLPGEVERKVEAVDEVKKATVELVWEPPWGREMMSESAMLQLGMY